MRISDDERRAIADVLRHGETFGYGNLIAHLQTAWALLLMQRYGLSEKDARATTGSGYPFLMQRDLVERGEWDETGESYRKPTRDGDRSE